jgi:hypothetical protein
VFAVSVFDPQISRQFAPLCTDWTGGGAMLQESWVLYFL